MKKRIVIALILAVMLILPLSACQKEKGLIEITLNEVAHSIFYAPMYVAFEEGYFEEEGLAVELVNGLGADKTMTALLSGEAEIGFMGAEASIYVYNEGAKDYAVNFSQLTQRAGNFLVSRNMDDPVNEDFDWNLLRNKTVIGGRVGGMPQMVFEYILKNKGIDPASDLNIIQNIDFGITAQSFASGIGDYTVEFEPHATALELEGVGKVVASLGVESGMVPYTAFAAKKSYIEKNPEVIQGFTNAIQKGMDYVNSHTPDEIAETIHPQFKETDLDTVKMIVKRYYDQDTWKEDTIFEEESFNLLQDILDGAGELSARIPYEDLITNEFAKKAKSGK
ncbi:MAG: ABC transporter substrate-binding protein [Clostridiales bacterium]|nr:ABC transporter substrate-binding protein [Clostridiales bacterium]